MTVRRLGGSRTLVATLTVLLIATSAIVFAAAARAKCGGRIAKAGTARADVMTGNRRANVFNGLGGADKLSGLAGGDKLCGGTGSDVISGAAGKDLLDGGGGNDRLSAGGGGDSLLGRGGRDTMKGGGGNDRLVGGPGRDVLDGGKGFDTCSQGERYVGCERILPLVVQEVSLGVSNSSFSIPASNVAPGDRIGRVLDLRNSSTVPIAEIALSTSAAPVTPLSSDAVDGLHMQLQRCSVQWSQSGAGYSCTGTTTTLVSERPVIVTEVGLPGLHSLQPGGMDHLLITLRLPSDAGQHMAGVSTLLTYTFAA